MTKNQRIEKVQWQFPLKFCTLLIYFVYSVYIYVMLTQVPGTEVSSQKHRWPEKYVDEEKNVKLENFISFLSWEGKIST